MAEPAPVELKPLPDQEALRYLRSKGYRIGFDWRDVRDQEHARSFTAAKGMRLDILADIREALDQTLAEGRTFEQFKRDLTPVLEAKGWWGRQVMTDPRTGQTGTVQLGSPRRLQIIFDTNIRTAHAAGDWARIERVKDRRPYLMYDAVMDGHTRPLHRSWNGIVLPVDDPWWDTHYPPNGWHCRCRVRQLSSRDLDRYGLQVTNPAPEVVERDWLNTRTGVTERVPEGIDPGFAYNVGKAHMRALVPPPDSGPLSVPAINPPPSLPMPPPRPADPGRLLPAIDAPGALTEEGYVDRFLAEFGATREKPALFKDVLGEPLMVGVDLFRQPRGDLKVTKRGREKGLLLLADTIKEPDEIWWNWEFHGTTGRWFLARRYLARFAVAGMETPAISVFRVGPAGWAGVTAFTPDSVNNLLNQRNGVLAYRRSE